MSFITIAKFLLKRSVSTVILFIIFFSYEGFLIISIDFFFLLLASPLRLWRFWREQFEQGWTGTGDNLFDAATDAATDAARCIISVFLVLQWVFNRPFTDQQILQNSFYCVKSATDFEGV